ncbi:MAG: class I SAM-dependent rRNA methyltransferase [Verrucomicrobiae bacterium]|nr:class I SAM-dependent rRNA methyltransferase [Verrucomicrobiae bacterium]
MSVAFLKDQCLGRLLAGHPWIYASDLLRIEKPPVDGGEITIRNAKGGYIGSGLYNSQSQIPIRVFTRSKEHLDDQFFSRQLRAAIDYRKNLHGGTLPGACRLVWSEADGLPGLIVDRYGETLVAQFLTLPLDQRKELIASLLAAELKPVRIVERSDVPSRTLEGLPLSKGILSGLRPVPSTARMGNIQVEIDFLEGQKTGSYLDQIENQQTVARFAKGRQTLDCFTYHGGFALHAAKAGAKAVEAWDISEPAIVCCRRNAALNRLSGIEWKTVNVFDELRNRQKNQARFDLIILDPPSFTKSRNRLHEALRGYKEIHLRALQLLRPGGLLASFCCSHHVDAESFRATILDAAFDARRILRLRHTFQQAPDHPILPAIPETEYLKGFLFEVIHAGLPA